MRITPLLLAVPVASLGATVESLALDLTMGKPVP
jgi:hypothetical protein